MDEAGVVLLFREKAYLHPEKLDEVLSWLFGSAMHKSSCLLYLVSLTSCSQLLSSSMRSIASWASDGQRTMKL
ncbi:hypothetical protein E2562_027047 [Oryza meyeriana var. granulata]|uniref:Uncharacterized protein n=1 Tax=Oryza meyeriana var. granulata TaxID=110450 RepID=A0A6G1C915_9ORYZ|nr:hypothetical protein E2562_027047 [Oryza meyeriana var. granulata]